MPEYYYQIKGKAKKGQEIGYFGGEANWVFPPIWSDIIDAESKVHAKELIEAEYGRIFPQRVPKAKLPENEYLLSIKELTGKDEHIKRLADVRTCKRCQNPFTMLNKYQTGQNGGGFDFCTDFCYNEQRQVDYHRKQSIDESEGIHKPTIYQIHNVVSKMSYIGKTTKTFTFRWYQHFYQSKSSGTKFHDALKKRNVTEWTFRVLEVVNIPDGIISVDDMNTYILGRESHYIKLYNTVAKGYNSRN